jgi:hypothetical protein
MLTYFSFSPRIDKMAFKREQFSWIIESVRRRGYQHIMKMSIVIKPKKEVDSTDFSAKE